MLRAFGANKLAHYEYPVLPEPRNKEDSRSFKVLSSFIERSLDEQKRRLAGLQKIEAFKDIRDSRDKISNTDPVWNNGFFPALDMMVLYSMLMEFRPAKYFEVGSGNSTRITRWCLEKEHIECRLSSIDPFPRVEIDKLSDEIIREPMQDIDPLLFDELESGDFLFIDNSHTAYSNSDVTVFFTEILPFLKKGVIVHIHDIYLPYDYPEFMSRRMYNEQYLLATTFLANSSRYDILLANYYMSQTADFNSITAGIWDIPALRNSEKHGGSIWMRISG